jgi:hypothetical protein
MGNEWSSSPSIPLVHDADSAMIDPTPAMSDRSAADALRAVPAPPCPSQRVAWLPVVLVYTAVGWSRPQWSRCTTPPLDVDFRGGLARQWCSHPRDVLCGSGPCPQSGCLSLVSERIVLGPPSRPRVARSSQPAAEESSRPADSTRPQPADDLARTTSPPASADSHGVGLPRVGVGSTRAELSEGRRQRARAQIRAAENKRQTSEGEERGSNTHPNGIHKEFIYEICFS